MTKIYIHIGTWKTGTTTIQNNLHNNQSVLLSSGYYYPELSANHGFMIQLFKNKSQSHSVSKGRTFSASELKALAIEEWERITKHAQNKDVILSSEFLLALSKWEIRNLKSEVDKLFSEVEIIVYLRDPLLHVSSAINEQVKQGRISLENAYKRYVNPSEIKKIMNWVHIFSKEKVTVRPFERRQFVKKDLLSDFFNVIKFQETEVFERLAVEKNKTLSNEALLIADKLHAHAPVHSKERANDNYLYQIKGSPFVAKAEFLDEVKKNISEDIEFVEQFFNIKFKPIPLRKSHDLWKGNTIASLSKQLNKLSRNSVKNLDVNTLSESAILLEEIDMQKALELMNIANLIKPRDEFIQQKIVEYNRKLNQKGS